MQKFRDTPAEFDNTKPDYASLLNFSLDKYKVDETASKETQEAPIEMSQTEMAMQTIVEVISISG